MTSLDINVTNCIQPSNRTFESYIYELTNKYSCCQLTSTVKDSIKREIDLINIIFNKNIIVDISEDGTIILKSDSEINVPITRNVLFEKKK